MPADSFQTGGSHALSVPAAPLFPVPAIPKRKYPQDSNVLCKSRIVINDVPDAIYKKDDDRLYFRKFETITPIFKGIDELYREATDEEVDEFLGLGFINLQGEYSTEKVKKANRKRIALAMESLNRYTSEQKDTIFNYTNNYFPHLRFNGTSFEVRNEEDLKNLLYGIEQRFYTTVATYEKRCASAVYSLE